PAGRRGTAWAASRTQAGAVGTLNLLCSDVSFISYTGSVPGLSGCAAAILGHRLCAAGTNFPARQNGRLPRVRDEPGHWVALPPGGRVRASVCWPSRVRGEWRRWLSPRGSACPHWAWVRGAARHGGGGKWRAARTAPAEVSLRRNKRQD